MPPLVAQQQKQATPAVAQAPLQRMQQRPLPEHAIQSAATAQVQPADVPVAGAAVEAAKAIAVATSVASAIAPSPSFR